MNAGQLPVRGAIPDSPAVDLYTGRRSKWQEGVGMYRTNLNFAPGFSIRLLPPEGDGKVVEPFPFPWVRGSGAPRGGFRDGV